MLIEPRDVESEVIVGSVVVVPKVSEFEELRDEVLDSPLVLEDGSGGVEISPLVEVDADVERVVAPEKEVDSDLEKIDEEDEEEPPAPVKGKRKAQSQAVARPTKKVAFAATTLKSTSKPRLTGKVHAPPSALKKGANEGPATAPTKTKPSTQASIPKKVANKAASKLKDVNKAQDQNAYDFGKFFK